MNSIRYPISYIPDYPPEIPLHEVYRYLGYGKQTPDSSTASLVACCAQKLSAVMIPRAQYAVCPIQVVSSGVRLIDINLFLPGKNIAAHLQGCRKAILFGATLSTQVDQFIRSMQISDMTSGVIADCCATAAIEQFCDDLERAIQSAYGSSHFTSRFSPGYGDLPLDIQKDFLNILDAPRKIGLCATDSSILTPRKSVTAVIGITDAPSADNRTGCLHCQLRETCEFKRKGEFCGLSNTAE